jgi:dihydropyrimidinase
MSTLIRNGTVVTNSEIYQADVWIDAGVIRGIARDLSFVPDIVIDATGKYIFPGGIDLHCHVADNYPAGTIAAACGGTTCIVEPSVQKPGVNLASTLNEWQAKSANSCAIDYGYHITIYDARDNLLLDMPETVQRGVSSYKIFLTSFPSGPRVSDADTLRVMQRVRENSALMVFHAECDALIDFLTDQLLKTGPQLPSNGAYSHSRMAEAEAVYRAIQFAAQVDVPVYFYHISSAMAVAEIARARANGQPVFAETCPHYLFLTEDNYRNEQEAAKYLCAPPLRDAQDQAALWQAIDHGDIQLISSDHVSLNFENGKNKVYENFTQVPLGIPGIETRIPLLYSAVRDGKISLNKFVDLVSTTPAKISGLYPRKGRIAVGSDADLVIFDPHKEFTLSVQNLHQPVDYCAYEGKQLMGMPDTVLLRGKVIVEAGEYIGQVGDGQYIPRSECQLV